MKSLCLLVALLTGVPTLAGEAICFVKGFNQPIKVKYNGEPARILEGLYVSLKDCDTLSCSIEFGTQEEDVESSQYHQLFTSSYNLGFSSQRYIVYGHQIACKDKRVRDFEKEIRNLGDKISEKAQNLK